MGVDSVSIEVSLLLAELSHGADRWGNLNRETHKYKYTNKPEENTTKLMYAEILMTIKQMLQSQ